MKSFIEYPRFRFQGFNGSGHCFLRVKKLQNENLVFLCVQLLDYRGTSVTNGIEAVLDAAVKKLDEDGRLPDSFRPPFYARHKERRLVANVVRHARWVEHYPPGAGLAIDGSYALVSFNDDLSPVWNYMSRTAIARACEVSEDFFDVNYTSLVYAK